MRLLKYFAALIIMLAAMPMLHSQAVLRTTVKNGIPAVMNHGETDTLQLTITNVGNALYDDVITFKYIDKNGNALNSFDTLAVTGGGLYYNESNSNDTISPGRSVDLTLIISADTSLFLSTPSVVVIWPISKSGNVVLLEDSVRLPLEVRKPTINGIETGDNARFYYYQDRIILSGEADLGFKYVRIFNEAGLLMYADQIPGKQSVSIPSLPAGIYFAEATLTDNRTRTIRFYKASQ